MVEGLKKHFPIRRGFLQRVTGWVNAVEDVSFRIEKGKTLGLVGESGCGKTTVARLILKLLQADEGKIIFNGRDISKQHYWPSSGKYSDICSQLYFRNIYGEPVAGLVFGSDLCFVHERCRDNCGDRT